MRRLSPLAMGLAISLAMAACSKSNEEAKTPEAPPAEPAAAAAAPTADSAAIDAAVASADRTAEDKERDARSRPAEVLTFMELRPDQNALDYFAAAGYYTELMSRVVGPNGKVIAYNNPEYRKFSQDGPTKRYGNNRLPNVTEVTTPVESVQLEPASLDAVLFMQGYHDLYWRPKDGSWPQTDPAKALAQIVPALKPGAVVVVVDHVANAGVEPTESATVDASHRPGDHQARLRSRGPEVRKRKPGVRELRGRSLEGSVRQGDPPQDGSGHVQVQEELRMSG